MRSKLIALGLAALAMVVIGAIAAGCGSDNEAGATAGAEADSDAAAAAESDSDADESATSTTTASTGGGETLAIDMGEFFYKPDAVEAKAGQVTIDASNIGSAPHELVLAKTNDAPDQLPTSSDGSVDEAALDVPGEVEEVEGGAEGTVSLDLQPGKYVMFCNLPGHYSGGMYGSLTVK